MIRPAEHKDIPAIVEMLFAFYEEAGCYKHVMPNKYRLEDFIAMMLDSDVAGIAILEIKGEIAGTSAVLCSPHWFNTDHKQAQELWWYVKPEFRNKTKGAASLFKFLEQWPKDHGCDSLIVGSTGTLEADRLDEFYTRRGFGRADVFYCKGVA